jgi:hypothetical protein
MAIHSSFKVKEENGHLCSQQQGLEASHINAYKTL